MNARQLCKFLSIAAALASLASCGSNDTPTASTTSISGFVNAYNQTLASVQTMNSPTFADLIDDTFLDAGYTKAQMLDSLKQDGDALTANPTVLAADMLYPMFTIEEASLSQCDDISGICQMSASYVNVAPDSTRSSAIVPVRFKDGKFRLYGDQKSI
jgi:hypothetical protein